ncbi:MAG: ThuA domain-containing protein [Clostridia bacterium]|nr:ThuA domain-containing protein [Clostridia bacterium]
MINVLICNEFYHEQTEENVKKIYPNGIHGAISDFLGCDDIKVTTVTEYDENLNLVPDYGITDEMLKETDVIMWWGHMRHGEVSDELVEKIHNQILCGMGAIFLHSAHHSKLFKKLQGTTCNLCWREEARERLWNIVPAHPIMRGIGDYFDIEKEEMYGERFEIPKPDELLMIGTYNTGEVFRSACTWQKLNGRVFYLQPGHESNPIYYIPEIQTIIRNAVRWAAPDYRAEELTCPHVGTIPFE